jgi:hypothetical protein
VGDDLEAPRAVLVIGVQAAGKSAVGHALAQRFGRGAFVEGDVLWKMVVSGRRDMSADPEPEAERQLALRYRQGAILCESFVQAGFTVVHSDNMFGPTVERHLRSLRCPRSLVVLRPSVDSIERRALERGDDVYAPWVPSGGSTRDAIRRFDQWIAETPPLGLWLDSSALDVGATVDEVIARWDETTVD